MYIKLYKLICILFTLLIFLSCVETQPLDKNNINFSITSPKQGWVYNDETKVMLAVNVNTQDVLWESNVSGYLGKGNHIILFLPEGQHRISAKIQKIIASAENIWTANWK